MTYIENLCARAKAAAPCAAGLSTTAKNNILETIAEEITRRTDEIITENEKDIQAAKTAGKADGFIDRLTLTQARLDGICDGLLDIIALPDPIGEVTGGNVLPNGLSIVKRRVPLGVIGVIFESRPNVSVDAAALCVKSGNCVVLRGGSDAFNSVKILTDIMRDALTKHGANADIVSLVTDTSRETAAEFMKQREYVDVLIPRGGKGLIKSVVDNAKIPVIETGAGVCHVYVDRFADIDMAVNIADNAKTQRPSVCNAVETILVHEAIASEFLKRLAEKWAADGRKMTLYGDERAANYITLARLATDEDFHTEWGDYCACVKVVDDIREAIAHINTYGTKHSEAIVTINLANAELFQREVDAAAVYVNASTRFTDGFEFGLGAEIGITTQKLHARGPLGLRELTTSKYFINGNGQIRA